MESYVIRYRMIEHFPKRHHPWEGQILNSWPLTNVLTCNKLEAVWKSGTFGASGEFFEVWKKEMKVIVSLKEDHKEFSKKCGCKMNLGPQIFLFDLQILGYLGQESTKNIHEHFEKELLTNIQIRRPRFSR